MVWDAGDLSGPVVFRWYRSVWTDLQPVTLTLSQPFTVLQLHWSAARTAYESRPVQLPCGRLSGTLRLNGVTRPLTPFRVTRFTFEVLLFLSHDVSESPTDEPDLPRYIPNIGSYTPARLRTAAAEAAGLEAPLSPTGAALERQHRQLVTQLAGVALLGELSADVRQLRRQTSANGRQVQALAHELRQERLQRRLAEAVRREVALLRAGGPRRGSREPGTDKAGQRGGKRRRRPPPPPPRAGDSEEWEDVPDSPPRRESTKDTSTKHHVTFDEATAEKEAKKTAHGLETTEMEKDFVYEDLCREERLDTEAELKTEKDVLRELAEESTEDEDDADLGGPFGSDPNLYETGPDLGHVPVSPPFVRYRTAGGDEVTVRPGPSQLTREHHQQLSSPWRPWYPSDLTPGQRAAVLTGGQVIRGHISHIWTSAGHTLVNIETNGWEDVTVPFEKVIMVW